MKIEKVKQEVVLLTIVVETDKELKSFQKMAEYAMKYLLEHLDMQDHWEIFTDIRSITELLKNAQ